MRKKKIKRETKPCFDLTGQQFGSWSVIKRADPPDYVRSHLNNIYWLCSCECGFEQIVRGTNLRGGSTKNCGCKSVFGRKKV